MSDHWNMETNKHPDRWAGCDLLSIITFCGGKYVEIFHELRTEIEIQKIGFMLDI